MGIKETDTLTFEACKPYEIVRDGARETDMVYLESDKNGKIHMSMYPDRYQPKDSELLDNLKETVDTFLGITK